MSELAKGAADNQPIHVGDQVMIRAEVLRSIEGVGALVRIYSKTDEQEIWIAPMHLRYAVSDADLPPEPGDGTWLIVHDSEGMPRIFHRDDAEGHRDDRRRHDQHWFDVQDQQWIDWPVAVERGAARPDRRQMVLLAPGQTDLDLAALDGALHLCWLGGNWEWLIQNMSPAAREAAAAAVERHSQRIGLQEPLGSSVRVWEEWG
jgi:hypothetical protein